MRILSHKRGNPDTEASRSLNYRVTSRLHFFSFFLVAALPRYAF